MTSSDASMSHPCGGATRLQDLAYARSGDKGDTLNIAIIAKNGDAYERILEWCTAERVADFFGDWVQGAVRRYELPTIWSVNYVLERALDGGITRSLRVDGLGKALGLGLLRMEIPDP